MSPDYTEPHSIPEYDTAPKTSSVPDKEIVLEDVVPEEVVPDIQSIHPSTTIAFHL